MIKLFGINDMNFSSNGDVIINPLRAVVHKEDNGPFYVDLETDLSYVDDLIEGNIIVANTPQGDQAFRVGNVQKTRSKIKTRCYHVFYDTENYLIADSYVVEKNCNEALDHLNSATDNLSPFTTLSDVQKVNTFRCVRKSLYEAIMTVLERWGGHLYRDNFDIQIRGSIGEDNGVSVRYAKNLKEIECDENWDNVVTKLMPVGKDGILLNNLDPSVDLYLYSDTTYDLPYTKTVSFTQEIDEEDFENEQQYKQALLDDLRIQGQNYIDENCVPKVNYTLKANLEKISDIGDTISVIDERLGIDLITHLISYDFDCILEKYTELEFGNFQQKLSNLMGDITSETQSQINGSAAQLQLTITSELQNAKDQIWDALGSSYVIYEGDKILVVDKLPKEEAVNVIMINSGGIAFSQTGINGNFVTAWTIDGEFNAQVINVINFTADLIKGGTLKLGSNLNDYGQIEIYDEANNLIAEMSKNGLKMWGVDHSYILINNQVGFAGYDRLGNKIYWVDHDEFHMKKSVIEEEITLCNKVRFIPITLDDGNGNITSDGIGLVSTPKA